MRIRFPALDGLRAIGALAVLSAAVGLSLNSPLLARLDVGVAIFFAISGFLLYRPHAVAWFEGTLPPLTLPYLRNRALRSLPVLCVAVLLAVLVDRHSPVWSRQLWIVAAAGCFNVLLPALAKLLTAYERPTRRSVGWRLAVLAVFTLLGPAWMAATATEGPGLWLPGYVGWFAVGMGFALWQVARTSGRLGPSALDTLAKIPGTLWGIAVALLLIAATPVAGPYDLSAPTPGQAFIKSLLYTGIAACVLFPAVTPTRQTVQVLGGPVAQVAGNLAYGVFAYHLIVLSLVERLTGQSAVLFVSTLVLSAGLAAASYYWMERPIMRLASRPAPAPRPQSVG